MSAPNAPPSNLAEIEIGNAAGTRPPTVTGFAPALATVGKTLLVNGSGFSAAAADNAVRLNGVECAVESAAPTQLMVREYLREAFAEIDRIGRLMSRRKIPLTGAHR